MVAPRLGVTNVDNVAVLSVCRSVPPELAEYQRMVPAIGLDAASVTVPVPHRDPFIAVGCEGVGITVATTGIRSLVHDDGEPVVTDT